MVSALVEGWFNVNLLLGGLGVKVMFKVTVVGLFGVKVGALPVFVCLSVNICGHPQCFIFSCICEVGLRCVWRGNGANQGERPWDVLILRLCSDCEMARFFSHGWAEMFNVMDRPAPIGEVCVVWALAVASE